MQTVRLGRTGLDVSVAGLGCGGHSRLGMAKGRDVHHAADIVKYALDLGITLIDTARAYGTEEAVGIGVKGRRDQVVISTKAWVGRGGEMMSAARDGRVALDGSLKPARHGPCRPLLPARRHARPVSSRPRRSGPRAEATADGRQAAVHRHQRAVRRRHRTQDAGPGAAGRPVRRGDGGVQPAQPLRPRTGVSPDPEARCRHADHVRGAREPQPSGQAAGGGGRAAGPRRGRPEAGRP